MDYDFHPPLQEMAKRRRKRPKVSLWLLLGLCVLLAVPLFLRQTVPSTEAHSDISQPVAPPPIPEIHREIKRGEIAPGDTLTALLGSFFSPQEIHALGQQSRPVFPLSNICAGQPYRLCTADGEFERFEYDIDRDEQLIISRQADEFNIERIPIPYTIKTERVRGVIESSLFEAVTGIGESDVLAMNLADIFAWDIDFILDIRSGDSFQALVEKRFREGQPAGYGRILAAEFTNQGQTYQAILFKDGERRADYFDAAGQSLRKAFLKAPLEFSRISSGFTMKRFHPITKSWKSHPAIDYAAPTGTPIKAIGDGTILEIGRKKGNGNYIKLRHIGSYETMYLHMSKFARGMSRGRKVSQGEVIGYVGSTGLATGPHLCFRMKKNGAPVNPQSVKTPSVAPISAANLPRFRAEAETLLARLSDPPTRLAGDPAATPQHN